MDFPEQTDKWILEDSPYNSVVVSSRARLARNLNQLPFAPRANPQQLHHIAQVISDKISRNSAFAQYHRWDLASLNHQSRCFLRESYLISNELEKGGAGRLVFTNETMDVSVMVNEEDHLRMTTLASGMRLSEVFNRMLAIESDLEKTLPFAFHKDFGYLTACPTNTGTGLRLSVMMHLPALTMLDQVDETLASLRSYGLVVRGAYGEHTDNIGDLYQISNEITLGKTEQELEHFLERLCMQIIEQEVNSRNALWTEAREKIEDRVCRAVGILANARSIDSSEAINLLSQVRLGIDHHLNIQLSHQQLSSLFLAIQPAHLQFRAHRENDPDFRDKERARLLRKLFAANPTQGEGQSN